MKVDKALYLKPEAEVFELPKNLNLLNSTSLGGTFVDWEDDLLDDEDWGDFIPYP